ncbi:hypothetical protein BJ508DRAFT_313643 [Ascobolus immersus RN42]|uniref:Uncharacterized protein n=1 Tax=Ascobolus immersus RN42 TaxID=1160509 RepID=A0A3N4HI04_ASCIM|nr:hypothetical protein BJ508DRAFT_313643 [Ascobolus immersus RN42]
MRLPPINPRSQTFLILTTISFLFLPIPVVASPTGTPDDHQINFEAASPEDREHLMELLKPLASMAGGNGAGSLFAKESGKPGGKPANESPTFGTELDDMCDRYRTVLEEGDSKGDGIGSNKVRVEGLEVGCNATKLPEFRGTVVGKVCVGMVWGIPWESGWFGIVTGLAISEAVLILFFCVGVFVLRKRRNGVRGSSTALFIPSTLSFFKNPKEAFQPRANLTRLISEFDDLCFRYNKTLTNSTFERTEAPIFRIDAACYNTKLLDLKELATEREGENVDMASTKTFKVKASESWKTKSTLVLAFGISFAASVLGNIGLVVVLYRKTRQLRGPSDDSESDQSRRGKLTKPMRVEESGDRNQEPEREGEGHGGDGTYENEEVEGAFSTEKMLDNLILSFCQPINNCTVENPACLGESCAYRSTWIDPKPQRLEIVISAVLTNHANMNE